MQRDRMTQVHPLAQPFSKGGAGLCSVHQRQVSEHAREPGAMERGTRQCSRHGSESIQLKKGLRRADQRHSPPCVVVNDRTRRSLQTSTGQALKKQPEAANVCLQPNRAGARNRVGMGEKYHPSAMEGGLGCWA